MLYRGPVGDIDGGDCGRAIGGGDFGGKCFQTFGAAGGEHHSAAIGRETAALMPLLAPVTSTLRPAQGRLPEVVVVEVDVGIDRCP